MLTMIASFTFGGGIWARKTRETSLCEQSRGRLFALILVACSIGVAFAQQPFGTVVGTVSDPTGATLPAASVTVTNTATQATQTLVTGATGDYSVPYLANGTYTLRAEHPGFRRLVVSHVLVQAAQTVRIDLRMQLGEVEQVLEVSATAVALQSDTAAVGTTIDPKSVSELPLNGRTFAQLATLVPGVAPQGSPNIATTRRRGSIGTAFAITANGFSDVQNSFVYDGVPAMDLDSYNFAFSPSIDTIAEFRVQTNSYSSSYGGAPGAHVELVTKSGTNAFHGTLWEFNRNDALAARNYFSTTKVRLNRNQFGANLGGPIRKNKAFFFFNWESGRQVQGTSGQLLSIPPLAFRTGDFSALLPSGIIIKDPATGQPFLNNQIPANRRDPKATTFLSFTPAPNRSSNAMGANNFLTSNLSTETSEDQYVGRVDYMLSSTDTMSARYMYDELTTPNEPPLFGNDENINTGKGQNLVINWTHTFSPRFVSNMSVGWNRFFEHQVFGTTNNPEYDIACGRMHLPKVACDPFNYGPPNIQAGYSVFRVRDNGPRDRMNQRWSVDQKNSVRLGRHLMDFGGSAYRLNWTFDEVVFPRGVYRFDGAQTTPANTSPTAAHQFADFLLGSAHAVTLSPTPFDIHENSWNTNLYIQDNWRLSNNLTLTLGLRWDLFMRPIQEEGTIANYFMDSHGGLIASGKFLIQDRPSGWPESLVFNDYRDFGPRLGLAWMPGTGTVVRAGFGLYFSPEISNSYTNMGLNAPYNEFVNVVASQSAPIDYGNDVAIDALFTGAGALGAFGVDPHLRDSRAFDWNLTIERSLPANIFMNIGYVGTHGSRLTNQWDANRAINPSLPGTPIVRPNAGFGAITVAGAIGTSDYHSLQLQVLRRVGTGLNVMAAYTFAKSLGDTDGGNFGSANGANRIQDIFNLGAARSIQSFDIRHRLSASVQYDIPFFSHGTGLVHHVFGGWLVNAIVTAQTGIGNGVRYGNDTSNTGVGSLPDLIADPVLPRSERSVKRWFNTAAFVAPPPGRFGNSSRLNFHNPGVNSVDFMVAKRFALRENVNATFRAEFFNLLNHTNLTGVDNSLTSPGFGTITSAADPRIIQFGLKLNF
jgi:Carboxypeptidase regulatory-like domain/TonB dependent receptor-like, beta-barrel